ncbi:DUF4245 family protein [Canibacter sp. lx-45]|uniref:DUF4245 domain-containing protein n=1 Tax=Canibacter zhuwentaonis TaxID=2837491 RepID=UPI001BDD69DF|nr:DUF4245 domain-containing protein [Canibacter zhuwentaonis]MBT1035925.1 DUF4245 family protein [Canibacter zhuwentaonis]
MRNSPKPVVAELGRPETAAETAARKAENSRLYKKRKTVNNLVYSLLVTLGLVLIMVLMVPRGTGDYPSRNVDVVQLAQNATNTAGHPLAAPQMPAGWLAKQAQLRHNKDTRTSYWYIGYTTPSNNYAAVAQGTTVDLTPASEAWVKTQLERKKQTGQEEFAGHTWRVYSHPKDSSDNSNVRYGYVTTIAGATLIVSGTASEAEVRELAANTVASLASRNAGSNG